MVNRLKSYFWIALGIGAFYFLLTHHIIFSSIREFDLLKKEEPTLEYTFYSIRSTPAMETLKIDILRDAGIEEILLKRGVVNEEMMNKMIEDIDARRAQE